MMSLKVYLEAGDDFRATHALSGVGFYNILTGHIKGDPGVESQSQKGEPHSIVDEMAGIVDCGRP